jgi:hypothetical protein
MLASKKTILFAIFVAIMANLSNSFLQLPQHFQLAVQTAKTTHLCNPITERTIYRNYLIGLRKSRKLLNNATNIHTLSSILNLTTDFIPNQTMINNTQTAAKNIIMGNIVLDVSKVKEIHIKTDKDALIIELDKNKQDVSIPTSLITGVNSLDNLITTLSLLSKVLNIN